MKQFFDEDVEVVWVKLDPPHNMFLCLIVQLVYREPSIDALDAHDDSMHQIVSLLCQRYHAIEELGSLFRVDLQRHTCQKRLSQKLHLALKGAGKLFLDGVSCALAVDRLNREIERLLRERPINHDKANSGAKGSKVVILFVHEPIFPLHGSTQADRRACSALSKAEIEQEKVL